MDMRGHFGIREDFRFGAVSFDGHHIDEHPVVFFIAEQNLIVGCETKAIRFFHGFFPQRKRDSTKKSERWIRFYLTIYFVDNEYVIWKFGFLECHIAPLFPGIKCRRSAVSCCRNCGIDAICYEFIADVSVKSEFSEGMPAVSELIERNTAVFPQLRPGGGYDRMVQKKRMPPSKGAFG